MAWFLYSLLASCMSSSPQSTSTVANYSNAVSTQSAPSPKPPQEQQAETVKEPPKEPVFEPDIPYPFLHDESNEVSLSIGNTSYGYVVNAKQIPPSSEYHQILPRQALRDLAYGTDEIIKLTEYVSQELYKQTGRKLWLGNIGKKGGGDIPYSVSHNSGRDIDIAFCYQDRRGNALIPPDLVHLNRKGISEAFKGRYRFDAPCTWELVKAFFTNPVTQIQYMFISNPLKKQLIAHAKRKKEDGKLIEYAELMLSQPRGAAPHNDHLHIRIYCSKKDVEGGCQNTGRILPNTDLFIEDRQRRIDEVISVLQHSSPIQRQKAAERLVFLDARRAIESIAQLLQDKTPAVRRAAAEAIGQLGTENNSEQLIARFSQEQDPTVQRSILVALRHLDGQQTAQFFRELITEPAYDQIFIGPLPDAFFVNYTPPAELQANALTNEEATNSRPSLESHALNVPRYLGYKIDLTERSYSLRLAAIEQAAHLERKEPVEALLLVLEHQDPLYRHRAAKTLHRLTNRSFRTNWISGSAKKRSYGIKRWNKWYKRYRKKSRYYWLTAGFRSRGYQMQKLDNQAIWELVRAVAGPDYLSYNAQKALMKISNNTPHSLSWSKKDACWYWARWFHRRHKRFQIPKMPPEVRKLYR